MEYEQGGNSGELNKVCVSEVTSKASLMNQPDKMSSKAHKCGKFRPNEAGPAETRCEMQQHTRADGKDSSLTTMTRNNICASLAILCYDNTGGFSA